MALSIDWGVIGGYWGFLGGQTVKIFKKEKTLIND